MSEKRFRTGKGILEEGYPSETIIDNETGKTYYKGYANYKSAEELCNMLNEYEEDNQQYKILVESLKNENQKLKLKLKDLGVEYY